MLWGVLLVLSCSVVDSKTTASAGKAKTFFLAQSSQYGAGGSRAVTWTLKQHPELKLYSPARTFFTERGHLSLVEDLFEKAAANKWTSGLKIPTNILQENDLHWKTLMEKYDTRYIALIRENIFSAAVEMTAAHSPRNIQGSSHVHDDAVDEHCGNAGEQPFHVDSIPYLASLMHMVDRENEETWKFATTLGERYRLKVTHEDYTSDGDGAMKRVYDFLGVNTKESIRLKPLKRVTSSPCALVSNYQEVCAALWGCVQFRRFLEDEKNGCFCADKSQPVTESFCPANKNLRTGVQEKTETKQRLESARRKLEHSTLRKKTDVSSPILLPKGTFRWPFHRNVCAGKAHTFLLGCVGHTGSSAVISTLFQHPELTVERPFEPLRLVRQVGMPVQVAETIFHRVTDMGLVSGFKIRPEHTVQSIETWTDLATKYKTRFISLRRKNIFLTAIGLYTIRALQDNAATMGLSHQSSGEHCASSPSSCYFEVDDIRFLAYLMQRANEGNQHTLELANTIPWPCRLDVTYEEYVSDTKGTMDRIYDFLGVERMELEAQLQKALPSSACVMVLNYQEVCAQLWGCELFRPWLEDPSNDCFCADKTRPANEEICDARKGKDVICSKINEQGEKVEMPCSVWATAT